MKPRNLTTRLMPKNPLHNVSSLFAAQKLVRLKYDSSWYTEVLPTIWPKGGGSMTLQEVMDRLYKVMLAEYRCEYVYKNEIIRQLLLKRHKTGAKAYTEMEIKKSIADVVIVNGSSSVYEIKTELDDLSRLEKQLCAYKFAFDKIFVVTHEEKLAAIKKVVSKDIGLIILQERGHLRTVREARSNKKNVRSEIIFELLRKEEYLKVIRSHFGYIPEVAPIHLFEECKKLFSSIEPRKAHSYMVKALRTRSGPAYRDAFFKSLPSSLKLIGLSARLTKQECKEIGLRLGALIV